MNEFIHQNETRPSRILDGLGRLLRMRLQSLSVCAAYTSSGGVALLSNVAETELGAETWNCLGKKFVPHVHILLTCGAFTPQGEFLELPELDLE